MIEEIVNKFCKEKNIEKNTFYIASNSKMKGKRLKYTVNYAKLPKNCIYVIRYYEEYKLVIIWNIKEARGNILSISKDKAIDSLIEGIGIFNKHLEYSGRGETEIIAATPEKLEKALEKLVNIHIK